ncbi:hypothetical protein CANCADRAFT_125633 [Tortispora caseinolytica NRRL Y-17796]|uniref:REM-1 domain-containing protein n=1 Tax=Tortispora caseinolytica NRRL Y-17796 TaxID=767744 RepID=A0A1E4TA21_9ASCO|nr:hypothetical protein CANCADRAFT_125633 [Tortispora caseinolytica NRRL Y-17796]
MASRKHKALEHRHTVYGGTVLQPNTPIDPPMARRSSGDSSRSAITSVRSIKSIRSIRNPVDTEPVFDSDANTRASPETQRVSPLPFVDIACDLDAPVNLTAIDTEIAKETMLLRSAKSVLQNHNAAKTSAVYAQADSQYQSAQVRLEQLKKLRNSAINAPPQNNLSPLLNDSSRFSGLHRIALEVSVPHNQSPTFTAGLLLHALEDTPASQSAKLVQKANEIVDLLSAHPELRPELVLSIVAKHVQSLLLHYSPYVVAAGFRLARYLLTDASSIKAFRTLFSDYIIIKSLTRDSARSIEREQALKFVRAFPEIPDGLNELSLAVLRTIVAIAENTEDKLRIAALEFMAEILVLSPKLAASCGAVRAVLQGLIEGPFELADSLILAYLHVANHPESRQYLRIDEDFRYIVYPLLESQSTGHIHEEKLASSAKVILIILRSWTGIYACSYRNFQVIRDIVLGLKSPLKLSQEIIIDMLFDLFGIVPPKWATRFYLDGREGDNMTYDNDDRLNADGDDYRLQDPKLSTEIDIISHMTSLHLALFFECGLMNALSDFVDKDENDPTHRKASLLVSALTSLSSKVHSQEYSTKFISLGPLFVRAANIDNDNRLTSAHAVYELEGLNKALYLSNAAKTNSDDSLDQLNYHTQLLAMASMRSSKFNSNVLEPTDSAPAPDSANIIGRRSVQPSGPDDSFRAALMDTQVLSTKNYSKWNWDLISLIITGPMLNPKRLDVVIKDTKFLKRIVSFFRPFKYRFSVVKNTEKNRVIVRIGCELIDTLMSTTEGTTYLLENKLIRQIAECIAQIDPYSGISATDPLLSRERMERTLTGGYFTILGTLTNYPQGIAILERWRIFSMLYHLVELGDRDDVLIAILSSLNYTFQSHPMNLVSKCLISEHLSVRVFTTWFVGSVLIKARREWQLSSVNSTAVDLPLRDFEKAFLRLLIQQLYDMSDEVVEIAVSALTKQCEHRERLDYIVSLRPVFSHLGQVGAPLLVQFVGYSPGYNYLSEHGLIEDKCDEWFNEGIERFCDTIESNLAVAFKVPSYEQRVLRTISYKLETKSVWPHNFFRVLVKTKEGCELLRKKKYFDKAVAYVRANHAKLNSSSVIRKVKAYIWLIGAVGSVGKSGAPHVTAEVDDFEYGWGFISNKDVVPLVYDIFKNSKLLTLRGTAFYALGLFSCSEAGRKHLEEQYNWMSPSGKVGEPGLALPTDVVRELQLKTSGFETAEQIEYEAKGVALEDESESLEDSIKRLDRTGRTIVYGLIDLANHILANTAAKSLATIQAKEGKYFRDPQIFRIAMRLLGLYKYRLSIRRFILDLFRTEYVLETLTAKI